MLGLQTTEGSKWLSTMDNARQALNELAATLVAPDKKPIREKTLDNGCKVRSVHDVLRNTGNWTSKDTCKSAWKSAKEGPKGAEVTSHIVMVKFDCERETPCMDNDGFLHLFGVVNCAFGREYKRLTDIIIRQEINDETPYMPTVSREKSVGKASGAKRVRDDNKSSGDKFMDANGEATTTLVVYEKRRDLERQSTGYALQRRDAERESTEYAVQRRDAERESAEYAVQRRDAERESAEYAVQRSVEWERGLAVYEKMLEVDKQRRAEATATLAVYEKVFDVRERALALDIELRNAARDTVECADFVKQVAEAVENTEKAKLQTEEAKLKTEDGKQKTIDMEMEKAKLDLQLKEESDKQAMARFMLEHKERTAAFELEQQEKIAELEREQEEKAKRGGGENVDPTAVICSY